MINNNWKYAFSSITILVTAAVLSGCGGTAYSNLNSAGGTATTTGTGTTIIVPTPTASTTSTGVSPLTFSGQITGSTGPSGTWTSPTINTDNTLQIRITPGAAGPLSAGTPSVDSNFAGNYNCASFDILVLGDQVATQDIAVYPDQNCYNALGEPLTTAPAGSQLIDFSSRLSAGHGAVTISVVGGRTDAYCQWLAANYNNPLSSAYLEFNWIPLFCEVKPIYKTMVATFTLSVGIDGTDTP